MMQDGFESGVVWGPHDEAGTGHAAGGHGRQKPAQTLWMARPVSAAAELSAATTWLQRLSAGRTGA